MGDLHVLDSTRAASLEATALGLALGDAEHLATLCAELTPEDYTHGQHAALHRLLLDRFVAGRGCDFVEVLEDIVRRGDSRYGGLSYVQDLLDGVPSTRRSMGPIVSAVKDAATRRRLIELARQAIRLAEGKPATVQGSEMLADSGAHAAEVLAEHVSALLVPDARHEWHAGEARRAELAERDKAEREGRAVHGPVSTGIDCLDETLGGGPKRQDLIVIGGRPGMGKTALALSMALEQACQGYRVGYFPMEMRASQLDLRALGYLSGHSPRSIDRESLSQTAWDDVAAAEEMYRGLSLRICDRPQLTLPQVVSQCRRWQASGGLDVVYVDYLQRMDHGRADRHDLAVGRTAQGLKNLARQLDVVVVALAQLGREVDKRRKPTAGTWKEAVAIPYASDLRESGQIEQEADAIVYPVRPTDDLAQRHDVEGSEALIAVAKNRHGPTAVLEALWDGPRFAYRDLPGAEVELLP